MKSVTIKTLENDSEEIELIDNLSVYLNEELKKRKNKNSGYSLRAFAKMLGVSSSFLSKVLNSKKGISSETLYKFSSRLNMHPRQFELFAESLTQDQAVVPEIRNLELDQFKFITDWYHFAIIEMATIKNCIMSSDNISKKLNISIELAQAAIDRLQRLEIIHLDQDQKVINDIQNFSTSHISTISSAQTEHERQILHKSIEALDLYSTDDRSQSSITMAIPKNKMKIAKKMIKDFRREFMAKMQSGKNREKVYQLSVSFFPLEK